MEARMLESRTPDVDAEELARAWCLLRDTTVRFDWIARAEGWPPLSPVRWLVLAQLQHATPFGFSARRLARGLRVSPSTLAYHLDALERAGFIVRTPCTVHDGRKVWVRLTDVGRYALHRLGGQPSRPPMRSPAIASP